MDCEECKAKQNDHETRIRALEISFGGFRVELNGINSTLTTIITKLDSLAQKPADRWDKITNAAISAVVGGILAIIISKLIV